MIITILLGIVLAGIIGFNIWLAVTTNNIPDITKMSVKKMKRKLSRVDCLKTFNNRLSFLKELNIEESDKKELSEKLTYVINEINKNKTYDMFIAYSKLKEIDTLIETSIKEAV